MVVCGTILGGLAPREGYLRDGQLSIWKASTEDGLSYAAIQRLSKGRARGATTFLQCAGNALSKPEDQGSREAFPHGRERRDWRLHDCGGGPCHHRVPRTAEDEENYDDGRSEEIVLPPYRRVGHRLERAGCAELLASESGRRRRDSCLREDRPERPHARAASDSNLRRRVPGIPGPAELHSGLRQSQTVDARPVDE